MQTSQVSEAAVWAVWAVWAVSGVSGVQGSPDNAQTAEISQTGLGIKVAQSETFDVLIDMCIIHDLTSDTALKTAWLDASIMCSGASPTARDATVSAISTCLLSQTAGDALAGIFVEVAVDAVRTAEDGTCGMRIAMPRHATVHV
jgi:hypothetical protein